MRTHHKEAVSTAMPTMPAVAMLGLLFGVASLIKLLVLAPFLYRSTDFEVCKRHVVCWEGMDQHRGGGNILDLAQQFGTFVAEEDA